MFPAAVPDAPVAAPADWVPIPLTGRVAAWRGLIAPAISLAVLVAAVVQMRTLDLQRAWALVPTSPVFWIAFVGAYLTLPVSEWLIYRRLWRLPASGIVPLLRKRISNEILLGYSGEVYFYGWARRRTGLATAPFGAIKDVAILSAQAGNLATLVLLALAWPMIGALHLGLHGRQLLLCCGAVIALSLPPLLLRRHVLSLPASALAAIGGVHLVRIVAIFALTAVMWHEALPTVALSWWVILAALRQLLTRLPLVPNKDIVFAGLAAYLIGPHAQLVEMIAMTTSLVVAVHLALGAILATAELAAPAESG